MGHFKVTTVTFDLLTKSMMSEAVASKMNNELEECFELWQKRLSEQRAASQKVQELMRQHNPVVIHRNHHVEAVILLSFVVCGGFGCH